jgi:hypothetical protein
MVVGGGRWVVVGGGGWVMGGRWVVSRAVTMVRVPANAPIKTKSMTRAVSKPPRLAGDTKPNTATILQASRQAGRQPHRQAHQDRQAHRQNRTDPGRRRVSTHVVGTTRHVP